ncbi:MAG: enoyl-CoA hydratase/isomerase family protein [Proteobacteria bacterium]|nr:enoyl-CoA hydratase/isomerase family protein [Pseudomonadota bacterium]
MANVELTHRNGVAIVTLNRPPVNALELTIVEELHDKLDEAVRSPARAVVLTGSGSCFSAGLDVKVVPHYPADKRRRVIMAINRTVHRLYGVAKPVVAGVNGHAIGGGLVLSLACDMRIAADGESRLGLTEVRVGVPFPAVPMMVVQAELDCNAARDLSLSGRVVHPREAHQMGLIDEVNASDTLIERTCDLALSLASGPVYAEVKHQLRARAMARMAQAIADETDPMLEFTLPTQ